MFRLQACNGGKVCLFLSFCLPYTQLTRLTGEGRLLASEARRLRKLNDIRMRQREETTKESLASERRRALESDRDLRQQVISPLSHLSLSVFAL